MQDEEREVTVTVAPLLGCNTALAPTMLPPGTFRRMKNTWQSKIGSEAKRPGSIPVTETALTDPIEWLGMLYANQKVMCASNKKLYTYNPSTNVWDAVTGSLSRSDIFGVDFTDQNSNLRKLIADGTLKEYNDSTNTVSAVVPSADAPSPEPPNALATIVAKGIRYVWSYAGFVFVALAKDDTVYYSKWYNYNYFPSVNWERWVRNSDYINGQGIAFDDNCLIPMRYGWGILIGDNYDAFSGNKFLNTPHGVIAPRSIQRIAYPNGLQTIAYLSDDGVHEVYDTGLLGEGSRRFSTRSLTENKLDMKLIGLSDAEKAGAVGFFDPTRSLYLLKFNRGSERIVYAYDTRNEQWYTEWDNVRACGFVALDDVYYAGETGHLHKFDSLLASDWDDKDKTTGTPIDMDMYLDIIALEDTGYASYLDYLIVTAKQFGTKSSVDVEINLFSGTEEYESFLKNQFMAWGVTAWGEGVWYNVDFTDLVGAPARQVVKKKSPYFQIRFRNNRDELVEIYRIKLIGRATGY